MYLFKLYTSIQSNCVHLLNIAKRTTEIYLLEPNGNVKILYPGKINTLEREIKAISQAALRQRRQLLGRLRPSDRGC